MRQRCVVTVHSFHDAPLTDTEWDHIVETVPPVFDPAIELVFEMGKAIAEDSEKISPGSLQEHLENLAKKNRSTTLQWRAIVLLARSFKASAGMNAPTGSTVYGWMMDNLKPFREGCAIFLGAIPDGAAREQERLALLRWAISHELGHVFNLTHEDVAQDDDFPTGRPDDIMYSLQLGLPATTTLERAELCQRALDYLNKGDESIRPGSALPFKGADAAAALLGESRSGNAPFTLSLNIAPSLAIRKPQKRTYVLGEPLVVSLKIKNRSRKTHLVPQALSSALGNLFFTLKDAKGRVSVLAPPDRLCIDGSKPLRLRPNESLIARERLAWRRGVSVLDESGVFEVGGAFKCAGELYSSNTVRIKVLSPDSEKRRLSVLQARRKEVALGIERGEDVLSHSSGQKLLAQNPLFPANAFALASRLTHLVDEGAKENAGEVASVVEGLRLFRTLPPDIRCRIAIARAIVSAGLPSALRNARLLSRAMECWEPGKAPPVIFDRKSKALLLRLQ